MNPNIQKILAPARAIVRPIPIPTHADIPVFPPDEKSTRTYYLAYSGLVTQRKQAAMKSGIKSRCRAKTTDEAKGIFRKELVDAVKY